VTNEYRDQLFQDLAKLAAGVVKLRRESNSWISDIQRDIDRMVDKKEELNARISDAEDKIKEIKVQLIRAEEKYDADSLNLKNTLLQP
jgi:seryl-tRNA synthetase